jgi:hypothetical protein
VITTGGDTLGELAAGRGVGTTVPVGDVAAWTEAIESLLEDTEARAEASRRTFELREEFRWSRVVQPLLRLAREPGAPVSGRRRAATNAEWAALRVRHAVAERGAAGAARRLAERLVGGTGRLP